MYLRESCLSRTSCFSRSRFANDGKTVYKNSRIFSSHSLTGCGKTLWARRNCTALYVRDNWSTPRRMLKKARLLTRPTLARRDAPCPKQGRSSAADPRFTFHTLRFTAPGSDARTPLTDFFSILLKHEGGLSIRTDRLVSSICRPRDAID